MIITIDGPAGSGKSTISKKLAKKFGIESFDTGAMYRAVAFYLLDKKIDIEDDEKIKKELEYFVYRIKGKSEDKKYFVCEKEVTKKIRTNKVTAIVSKVAAKSYVRKYIVKIQREFAKDNNAIFEGRDMGSVVFPCADMKFFLSANPKIRAKRRFLEMKKKFPKAEFLYKNILEDIEKRDAKDINRKHSPLKCPKDAICIDTTKKTIKKVLITLEKKINKYIKRTTPKFFSMKPIYGIVLFIVWSFFKIFYRLQVYGAYNLKKGAGIIASSHGSYLDPPIIAISSTEEITFLAKESLFKIPIFSFFIKKLNALSLSKKASDISTFRKVVKELKKNRKILLFPEGERSQDGKIAPFKMGAAYIAYLSKCKIVPAYIDGAYSIWSIHKKLPKLFGKIVCVFGSAINIDDIDTRNKKEFMLQVTTRLEESVKNLKKWVDSGAKGFVP